MKAIYAAFVKAQKEFGPALKTSTNPHFRSRYADLSACVEAVVDALNNNGLGLVQCTHECPDGVIVETILIHESGENMTFGKLHVPATKHDAQGFGSALTYARRYSLMAACGIAPEDDDGNKAVKTYTKAPAKPAVDDELPEWGAMKAKKETSRAVPTRYDITSIKKLDAASYEKARTYLKENSCQEESADIWLSPIRLEKLTSCIVK